MSVFSKIKNKEHLSVIFKNVKNMSKMLKIQKSRNTIFNGSYKESVPTFPRGLWNTAEQTTFLLMG